MAVPFAARQPVAEAKATSPPLRPYTAIPTAEMDVAGDALVHHTSPAATPAKEPGTLRLYSTVLHHPSIRLSAIHSQQLGKHWRSGADIQVAVAAAGVVVDGGREEAEVVVVGTVQVDCKLAALFAGGSHGGVRQRQGAEADKPAQLVSAVVHPHIHLELPDEGYFAHTSSTGSAKL